MCFIKEKEKREAPLITQEVYKGKPKQAHRKTQQPTQSLQHKRLGQPRLTHKTTQQLNSFLLGF
jgi:hypothetical protein